MDRNTIIGLVLIACIVLTWAVFFSDSGKDDAAPKPKTQTENVITDPSKVSPAPGKVAPSDPQKPMGVSDSTWASLSDSARQDMLAAEKMREHGDFSKLYEGEDKVIQVETDKYNIVLHTKGARMGELLLKDYMTSDSHALPIQTDSSFNFLSVSFMQKANVKYPGVATGDLYFEPSATTEKITVTGDAEQSLSLKAKIDDAHYIEYIYTFRGNAYDYGLEIKQSGMNDLIEKQAMQVNWQAAIPKTEKTMELMREKTTLYYRESGSVSDLGQQDVPLAEPEVAENRVDWVAFHSQFFTHTMMTEDEKNSFENVKFWQVKPVSPDPDNEFAGNTVRYMTLAYDLPIATQPSASAKYTFYAGPLDFKILKDYDRDMIKQVGLGWGPLQYINRFLTIPVFGFLQEWIASYGLIILLLGLIIKTLIYPLTYRTYISTARMRLVNNTPEVKELEAKHKDDPTKLQQAKMAVYRQYGVSMFGGCWPMLVQYPFLIALFFFFPNSIELRQKSFLWAPDLSTYDSIMDLPFTIPFYGDHVSLFTLLMTASIFAYTIINQRMQPQQSTNPVMKWFPYIMPIILLGFLNKYSAGLSWYYLLSNLISIGQTLLTKYFVSDEKLFQKMVDGAKAKLADPNKKKGTLERWAERQQQRQRDVSQQRQEARGEAPAARGAKTTAPKKRR
jgi:YidC/Oxa1 family membrane protein insertase